ncbi:MAG: hypothetical protein VB031_07900 [Eubacteriaceae bacterium]|nr:hypothetical protein [Eubacteriaceae bacterium]
MFDKKIKMNITDDESQLLLFSLVELRNNLIKEGRYLKYHRAMVVWYRFSLPMSISSRGMI